MLEKWFQYIYYNYYYNYILGCIFSLTVSVRRVDCHIWLCRSVVCEVTGQKDDISCTEQSSFPWLSKYPVKVTRITLVMSTLDNPFSLSLNTGTFRLLSVHIMTLKVPMSTHHPCPLSKMWQLEKESPFLQTHRSLRPGGYRTQVWIILHAHSLALCAVVSYQPWRGVVVELGFNCTYLCVWQVQRRGRLGFVLSTLVGISLGT